MTVRDLIEKLQTYPQDKAERRPEMTEYVKVKKEDLIKVHKDSCSDVKKVLEGLYPGELEGEKTNSDNISLYIDRDFRDGFAIYVRYNGKFVGYVPASGIVPHEDSGVTFHRKDGYSTVIELKRK